MRFLLQSIKSDEAAQHPTEAGEMLTASCSVFSLSLSLPPRSFSEGAPKEGEGGGRGRAGAVRGQWRGRGKGQGSVGGGHGGRGQGARGGRGGQGGCDARVEGATVCNYSPALSAHRLHFLHCSRQTMFVTTMHLQQSLQGMCKYDNSNELRISLGQSACASIVTSATRRAFWWESLPRALRKARRRGGGGEG